MSPKQKPTDREILKEFRRLAPDVPFLQKLALTETELKHLLYRGTKGKSSPHLEALTDLAARLPPPTKEEGPEERYLQAVAQGDKTKLKRLRKSVIRVTRPPEEEDKAHDNTGVAVAVETWLDMAREAEAHRSMRKLIPELVRIPKEALWLLQTFLPISLKRTRLDEPARLLAAHKAMGGPASDEAAIEIEKARRAARRPREWTPLFEAREGALRFLRGRAGRGDSWSAGLRRELRDLANNPEGVRLSRIEERALLAAVRLAVRRQSAPE